MSDELAKVQNAILISITQHKNKALKLLLARLPIRTMKILASNIYLTELLKLARTADNSIAFKLIIAQWSKHNPEQRIRPIFIEVFRLLPGDEDLLKYMVDLYPDYKFRDCFMALNNFEPNEVTNYACQMVSKLIPIPEEVELDDLLSEISELHDSSIVVKHHLEELLKSQRSKIYIRKPEWIIGLPSGHGVSEPHPQDFELRVSQLMEKFSKVDPDFNLVSDDTLEQLRRLIPQILKTQNLERLVWLEEFILFADVELLRMYGPCWPINSNDPLDPNSKNPCLRHGGCRMFLCWEYENFYPDSSEEIIQDIELNHRYHDVKWFVPNCEVCGKSIPKKTYALRMPMAEGGWEGCFCSFTCMRDVLVDSTRPEEKDARLPLIDKVEKLIAKYGLYDQPESSSSLPPLSSSLMTLMGSSSGLNLTFR